jgi:hypothetical protein
MRPTETERSGREQWDCDSQVIDEEQAKDFRAHYPVLIYIGRDIA